MRFDSEVAGLRYALANEGNKYVVADKNSRAYLAKYCEMWALKARLGVAAFSGRDVPTSRRTRRGRYSFWLWRARP